MGWIYRITNTVNGKIYIGKTTVGVSQRWEMHLKCCFGKYRGKSKLYPAILKYGV